MSIAQHPPAEKSLQQLRLEVSARAKSWFKRDDEPVIVASPYRFNPLGAHVDHQGGAVMARTIDQYTVLAFYPATDNAVRLVGELDGTNPQEAKFGVGEIDTDKNWVRYAMASAACTAETQLEGPRGFCGYVLGTLVGAGLSSSASVILAYVEAFALCNKLTLSACDMVERCRQVENEYMGLNNGVQDQMSVVFGKSTGLSVLDVNSVSASYVDNPADHFNVSWVLCYSGFSRELVSSGFNDRVRECREAASLLDASTSRLGDVPLNKRSTEYLDRLPAHLARRAKHVYGEMQRVSDGAVAWASGDWPAFGALMNTSCDSSMHLYECGSEPMVALQKIALAHPQVFGSRFSGGGYGGCLNMLVHSKHANAVCDDVLAEFVRLYPHKHGIARAFVASAEDNVRVLP